jgi:chromosome segregation ATPase
MKLVETVTALTERVTTAEKQAEKAENKVGQLLAKLSTATTRVKQLEEKERIIIPENIHITTLENKYNKLVGKVVSAKNKITALNQSTPYRPGAVERTLKDVLEDIGNVSIN